ncbi:adenosine receptor A3-like isoform X2 [Oculina patagonica]
MMTQLPASDCIPWLVVSITECLAIVILNIITIIVFVKQRQLQRRSTYLIIHLAIVDLLAGAVSGPVIIELLLGKYCDLWEYNYKIYFGLRSLFPITSLVNLAFISLERLHATFCPFKHRVIKKWIYVVIITVMWLITTSREFVQVALYENRGADFNLVVLLDSLITLLYWAISLLVICVCYICIFIKVRCCPHPQSHGAANRERKLTGTLVLVTLASEFSWLPFTVFEGISYFHYNTISNLSLRSHFHTRMILAAMVGANSLANPIVYALRMPEYRKGIAKIFRRAPVHINRGDLPLENM